MRIRNQFIISTVVFSAVLLIVAASVIVTNQQIAQLDHQQNISGNVQQGAGELNTISSQYFLFQQTQQLTLWQSNIVSISGNLTNLNPNNSEQNHILSNLSGDLGQLNASFVRLVSFLETAPRNVSVRVIPEFQNVWNQTVSEHQTFGLDASRLSESLRAQADQLRLTNIVLLIALLGVFGAFFLTNYFITYRRTLKSISSLQAGLNIVGSGNLDYSIDSDNKDEIGQLSSSFNQMTANLKTVTAYSRSLIEASLDPLVTINAEGKITDVNKSTEEVTGYTREELVGSDFSEYFTEPEKARLGYRKVFTEGFVRDYPLAIRSKLGRITDVLYNATVYRNQAGAIQGVFAAARDVTERKLAEQELLAASLYSRSLIEASLDPLVTINKEGKITDVNKASEDVTGCSREELIGSDFSDYFTEPEEARAGYQKVFTEGFVKDYPLAIQHKSGGITDVLYNASIYRNPHGEIQGVFAAARDITERKAMENEIKQTMEKLKQSNSELEQFAYVASHDLQEPLRMVASYVQLLERRYKGKLDADADEFIGYAVDGANRMRGLIDDLLTYSRVSRLGKPFEPVNVESTLGIVLLNLQASIADNHAVVTHDKLPEVVADGGQLVQLFQNLIGNAIKFHGKEPPRVHVSAHVEEAEYLFSVKDNGIGIASEYFDRLFKIFQRLHTREEYPGSGIGLAVCKRIVERHGGRIWIESKVGKGSTVYFTLNKRKRSD